MKKIVSAVFFLLLFAIVFAATGDSGQKISDTDKPVLPFPCGDGQCIPPEDSVSCPIDCPLEAGGSEAPFMVISDARINPVFFPPQTQVDFNVIVTSAMVPVTVRIDINVSDVNSVTPLEEFSFPALDVNTVPATFDKDTFSEFVDFISSGTLPSGQYYASIALFDEDDVEKDTARVFFNVTPLQQNPLAISDTHPLLAVLVAIVVLTIVLPSKK